MVSGEHLLWIATILNTIFIVIYILQLKKNYEFLLKVIRYIDIKIEENVSEALLPQNRKFNPSKTK